MNMAQPSVTREPSMEEILASIRRIIESNEPDAARPAGAAFAHKTFESDPVDPDPMMDDEEPIRLTVDLDMPSFAPERPQPQAPRIEVSQPRIEVSSVQQREPMRFASPQPPVQPQPAFASAESMAALAAAAVREAPVEPAIERREPVQQMAPEPQMAPPAYEAPRKDEEPRSISLADVAARVRAASERIVSDPTRQPVRDIQPAMPAGRNVELRAAPAERSAEPVIRAASSIQPPRAPEPLPVDEEIRAALNVRLDQIDDDMLPVSNLVSETEEEEEGSKALVSASTGDQVARSFHELAEMVNSNSKRSMDEVAEDLLRPMLQEWLDDNLPTLVERLVREEIERVARGPRR